MGATEDTKGHLRTLERVFGGDTRQTMFQLPVGENNEHEDATSNRYHFSGDLAVLRGRPLPNVRFRTQTRESCAVYNHPNNIAHREQQRRSALADITNEQAEPAGDGDIHDAEALEVAVDGDPPASASDAVGDANEGEESGNADDGLWMHNDDDGHFFELNFAACQKGKHFITKAIFEDGKTGIQVGKVVEITDADKKEFKGKMYRCTKNCYEAACIQAQWNITNQYQQIANYEVITYFDKLTQGKKLQAKERGLLAERGDIDWTEPET